MRAEPEAINHDIHVMAVKGGSETTLIESGIRSVKDKEEQDGLAG
jgi:hypothetical protein